MALQTTGLETATMDSDSGHPSPADSDAHRTALLSTDDALVVRTLREENRDWRTVWISAPKVQETVDRLADNGSRCGVSKARRLRELVRTAPVDLSGGQTPTDSAAAQPLSAPTESGPAPADSPSPIAPAPERTPVPDSPAKTQTLPVPQTPTPAQTVWPARPPTTPTQTPDSPESGAPVDSPRPQRTPAAPRKVAAVDSPVAPDSDEQLGEQQQTVRGWPLVLIALPAFVAVWAGWVGLGGLTGFGPVTPLPGIAKFTIDTAITLPIGVEAYAAYALRAWLSGSGSAKTRQFAKRSAIGALLLGAGGQVAYHLLAAANLKAAPWWITTIVACLPVACIGMGAALHHMLSADKKALARKNNKETKS